jgi:hypothetical protein
MKIYILHEAHSECGLNYCEVFVDPAPAIKLLSQLRDKFLNSTEMQMPEVVEIYCDDEDELYFTDATGESIRFFITEHTI